MSTAAPGPPRPFVGRPLRRREDPGLVTGAGRFIDDLRVEGAVHLAFCRSPLAHARIRGVDAAAALAMPGILKVVTAADLAGRVRPLPLRQVPVPPSFWLAEAAMPCLAEGIVRFVGEAVAAVVAVSRAAAADAVERIVLDLEPLPTVVDPELAVSGAAPLHGAAPDNVLLRGRTGSGDVDRAFADAAELVEGRIRIPRLAPAPIEPRGCVAVHDPETDRLTLHCSSQDPHRPLAQLCWVLDRPRERTRVVVADTGGAFGSKGGLSAEHAVAAWCALELRRPVVWVETRTESFLAAYQGRGWDVTATLAVARDGRFLGLRARAVADLGAYLLGHTQVVALSLATLLTGAYDIPAADVEVVGVATNKTPTGPLRGAGRPEATHTIERLCDLAARRLGLDPVEIRRRNLIARDRFPYRSAVGAVYDSGDYAGLLDRALAVFDYAGWRARQVDRRARGSVFGIGVALMVESSGGGLWESASVGLTPKGTVVVRTGSSAHGQGHQTTFAQVAADVLGVDPDQVEVRQGDSDDVPAGVGTYGSRSAAVGGSAVQTVAEALRARLRSWAAHLLDAPEAELRWEAGRFVADGPPSRSATLGDIARAAAEEGAHRLAEGLPELEASGRFTLPGLLYGAGAYCAALEVDRATGAATVRSLVAVDDAGTILNPRLADGQVEGAALHGLAAALFEEVVHDPDGQPQTASWIAYATPTAAELTFELRSEFRATPSPLNPLGAKGVGEAGAIGVPAALANAAADALQPFGIDHVDIPLTPERLWRRLQEKPR